MNQQQIDLITIGEIVMDLLTEEQVASMTEATAYQRHFGGSPANIAVNLSQLGFSTAMIGRIGRDPFGDYALRFLQEKGVDIQGVQLDQQAPTTAIFVSRTSGTPEVIHYRGADTQLSVTEAGKRLIDQARWIHFSGFALSRSPAREAVQQMKEYALRQGKKITFDPCYHAPLWPDPAEGRRIFQEFMHQMWIIKPSYDDLTRLWGKIEPEEGIRRYHQLGVQHVILTLGAKGVLLSDGEQISSFPGQLIQVQDATGAGDSFWSGVYAGLLLGQSLEQAVQLGMQTAAITLQHRGAIAPLPCVSELINNKE